MIEGTARVVDSLTLYSDRLIFRPVRFAAVASRCMIGGVPMESITFRAPRDLKAAAELVARIEKTSVGDLTRTALLTYLTFKIAGWDNEITEAFLNSFAKSKELNEAMQAAQALADAWPLHRDAQGT